MSNKKRLIATLFLAFTFVLCLSSSLSSTLRAHFLDVNQADCIIVQTPNGKSILIDAGNLTDSQTIASYLDNLGILKLDVVIGTHPHADHIGGMAQIIRKFEIGKIFMPFVSNNTATFQDLLTAIKEKAQKISTAKAGIQLELDSDLILEFLAPISDAYGNLNDYSAVLKITYKETSFLLCGDAGIASEEEMLRSGADLRATVLKVAHHGSASSTSSRFLDRVLPRHAIISVGDGNSYGHPSPETIKRLAGHNIGIFRTDLDGTIIVTSDGETLRLDKIASPQKPKVSPAVTAPSVKFSETIQTNDDADIVYVTRTGKRYHRYGCQYLSRSCIPIELKKAKEIGYTPCKVCKPPY